MKPPEKTTTLERDQANIVILGAFNPAIFHTSWLLSNNVISKEDAEDTDIKVVHPEISTMFIGKWLNIEITRERFFVFCDEPHSFLRMRDFVQGCLLLLEHTPVTALGINFQKVLSIKSKERLDKIVSEWCFPSRWSEILDSPSFNSIKVRGEKAKEDCLYLTVKTTDKVDFGLAISFNYHKQPDNLTALGIVQILNNEWKQRLEDSNRISKVIIGE